MKRMAVHVLVVCIAYGAMTIAAGGTPAGEPDPSEAATSLAGPAAAVQITTSLLQRLNFHALWTENTLSDWLVVVAATLIGVLAGRIAAVVLLRLARRMEDRGWPIYAQIVRDLVGPLSLALLTMGLAVGLADLTMSVPMDEFRRKTLRLLYTIAAFWYVYNLVALVDLAFRGFVRRTESTLDERLAPLVRTSLRMFLLVVGVLFVVDTVFEQDIGAWLAGLGIAGLAISLAAQDSLKNLIGSLTVLLDRPYRIGDRIICTGCDGVVEEIGLRSTKIRTAAGHIITIPNLSIVANPVENIGRRPYIRRSTNLAVPLNTPPAKVTEVVDRLRAILQEDGIREPIHRTVSGEDGLAPRVYFSEYNPSNLGVTVVYWYSPPDYWSYMEHAHRLNLRILEELAGLGVELAKP